MLSPRIFFRDLLRPTITSVQAIVYEDRSEKDLQLYKDFHLQAILKALNELWKVETKPLYWFEAEAYEEGKCFQKRHTVIRVTCYTEDLTRPGFKKRFPIPLKYRKKFFDVKHSLVPEPVGYATWPPLQVAFVLTR